jgi:uncharacterized RDD family membrane protein YckC/DNA-directed RNA polymerase subunit RPC12/RpoP
MTPEGPAQAVFACSQCGRTFGQSDLVQIAGNWVCGNCKPAFLSRVMAGGAAAATSLQYAGVGIRFGARFVDGLVFIIPFAIVAALIVPNLLRTAGSSGAAMFNGSFLMIALIFSLFYEVLMLKYWGATLGKMACGLKVVRPDATSLGWGISFGRYFMYNVVISAIPLLNYILLLTTAIMAGVDAQKRGLHDRVCDTRVVYKRSLA